MIYIACVLETAVHLNVEMDSLVIMYMCILDLLYTMLQIFGTSYSTVYERNGLLILCFNCLRCDEIWFIGVHQRQ